ncbi:MAG: dihydroorotase [Planctomyces sp.]|nr:dihydroorotase [Planctomyces sp.]
MHAPPPPPTPPSQPPHAPPPHAPLAPPRAAAAPGATRGSAEPLLIVNGSLVDPESLSVVRADVAVASGVIAAIGPRLDRSPAARLIDAEGLLVCPGLIDPHVHLREPGHERAETIASGAAAALAGGFTSVCCMPNTTPTLDSEAMVRYVGYRAAEAGAARVFAVGALTVGRRGEELADIALMARAGAVAFSDDGDCLAWPAQMLRALRAVRSTGRALMQHCQEPTLTRGAVMHAGEVAARLDLTGWPGLAEELIIERDIRLNRAVGCRYHAQHVSSAGSVELLRRARAESLPVSGEATPHHLLLTCDLVETSGYDARYKVNPPIRERADVDALLVGIADGSISVLATDHAPHTPETKQTTFDAAAFGMIGLETALGLYARALIEPGVIAWPRLIRMLTLEPARLCGLDRLGLGQLRVGGPADVTLIDPAAQWTIAETDLVGLSRNTPFLGWRCPARPVATIVRGELASQRPRS